MSANATCSECGAPAVRQSVISPVRFALNPIRQVRESTEFYEVQCLHVQAHVVSGWRPAEPEDGAR